VRYARTFALVVLLAPATTTAVQAAGPALMPSDVDAFGPAVGPALIPGGVHALDPAVGPALIPNGF
jgi:hypothetical protein